MIRWFAGYLKKYKWSLALAVLFAALSGALLLVGPLFLGRAVDALTAENGVKWDELTKNLVLLAVFYVSGAVLSWISPVLAGKIAARTVTDIRNTTFRHILDLPLRFFDTKSHGDVIARITTDCENIYDGLGQSFVQLFSGIVTVIGTLVAMFVISPVIAAAVLCITPLSLLIARFVIIRTARLFAAQQKLTGELGAHVEEMFSGIRTVHEYSLEEEAAAGFGDINARLYKTGKSAQFGGALVNPSTRLVNNISYICVGLMGAVFAVNGIRAGGWTMTVGVIATLLSYATQFAKPINEIAGVTTQLQNAAASAARLKELQEEVPESDDSALPELRNVAGAVEIEHLKFSYVPEKPLITDLSLSVRPGSVVAIVGPTGGGKTTLVNLLLRFYDPLSGTIRLDGTDTQTVTRDSLRDAFSMVLQETWLFTGTVRDNIAYGRPGATDAEVKAAAKAAYAHNFIKRLPQGYDTMISDGGGNLSGGQRQLLTIARAMLSDAPVLVLDEATSSVDIVTEQYVQQGFARLMSGRTSFIIAHRLATIRHADLILVVDGGNIVEQGTHAELLAARGRYWELYNAGI
ncbi:MAG: ABC transporter ATP-binding protein [Clostridia bacterium]|nr:ABC transporter ATP-binding protein [Clostridia bacterium]